MNGTRWAQNMNIEITSQSALIDSAALAVTCMENYSLRRSAW
jgi:hypothetical protein